MDRYKILGLVHTCTKDEIKKAFHKMAMLHHPDKGGDVKKFIEVKDAYEWLMKYHNDNQSMYQYSQTQEPRRGYKKVITVDEYGNTSTIIYYNVN